MCRTKSSFTDFEIWFCQAQAIAIARGFLRESVREWNIDAWAPLYLVGATPAQAVAEMHSEAWELAWVE